MTGDRDRPAPSTIQAALADRRVRRCWGLGLLAVVLHGVLDPLATYLAVSVLAVGTEANPLLAGHLDGSLGAYLLVHVPLYAIVGVGLMAFTWLFGLATPTQQTRLYRWSLVGWGLVICWGALLVANALWVVLTSSG